MICPEPNGRPEIFLAVFPTKRLEHLAGERFKA
jgi:hypothetical protein